MLKMLFTKYAIVLQTDYVGETKSFVKLDIDNRKTAILVT